MKQQELNKGIYTTDELINIIKDEIINLENVVIESVANATAKPLIKYLYDNVAVINKLLSYLNFIAIINYDMSLKPFVERHQEIANQILELENDFLYNWLLKANITDRKERPINETARTFNFLLDTKYRNDKPQKFNKQEQLKELKAKIENETK